MIGLLQSFRRVLVLGAHTDDEMGCAGTIIRLLESGAEVRYVAMSRCEESVPLGLPRDILVRECYACTSVLGIPYENVDIWDFPVRYFPRDRQAILERLIEIKRSYNPDLVFLPSTHDTHQDHAVVSKEGFRAFKESSIFGYELPQNITTFTNSAFVALRKDVMDQKIRAISEYRSQEFRPYSSEEFIRSLGTVRGVHIGVAYAEAFEIIRLAVLDNGAAG